MEWNKEIKKIKKYKNKKQSYLKKLNVILTMDQRTVKISSTSKT